MNFKYSLLILFLVSLSFSCSDDGTDGLDGQSTLVNVSDEPAGDNCATGGLRIETGIDVNLSGTLEADEVQSVSYVCDGESLADEGQTYLVITGDITNEEAQAKVDTEVGENTQLIIIKNTTQLTSLEIPQVESLVELVVEGNKALGTLDLPNLMIVNDKVSITGDADDSDSTKVKMNALQNINVSLELTGNTASELELNSLEKIGMLQVLETIDLSLNLPELVEIEMMELRDNSNDLEVSAPKLNTIGSAVIVSNTLLSINLMFGMNGQAEVGSLEIMNNPLIEEVGLDWLGIIGDFHVSNNESLEDLNLPNVVSAGDVEIHNNFFVSSIAMENLETVNSVFIYQSQLLESINISQLESIQEFTLQTNNSLLGLVANDLTTASVISISNNAILDHINIPNLINVDFFGVSGNNSLTSVDLGSLEDAGTDFGIFQNSTLTDLNIDAISTISDNSLSFNGNGFSSATVNYILARMVSLNPPLSNGTINLQQSSPAPPTGQGVTDKGTLENAGNTVNTD
ncbi:DUF7151 family protein [Ekhidna sp. To15]|uniref:DUF7151 family protein n=1 Tax=Ekhidna sp. To15 TaxID=3395267 RepID=UPI003F52548B